MQSPHAKKKAIEGKKHFSGSVGIDKGDAGKVPSNVNINIKRLEKSNQEGFKEGMKNMMTEEPFSMEEYEKNEENNNHSENYLQLAKMYGTQDEIADMESAKRSRDNHGNTFNFEHDEQQKLHEKYYPKFLAQSRKSSEPNVENRHHDSTVGSAVFDNQPSMNVKGNKPVKNHYAHDKTGRSPQ